jgi:hypothetical protein
MKKSELRQIIREMLKEELRLHENANNGQDKIENVLEYDTLWEDTGAPVIKTFGRKTYDLSKDDELDAWIEANVAFQLKRYPAKYDGEADREHNFFTSDERIGSLRHHVIANLANKLEADGISHDLIKKIRAKLQPTSWSRAFSIAVDKRRTAADISEAVGAGITAFLSYLKDIDSVMYHWFTVLLSKTDFDAAKNDLINAIIKWQEEKDKADTKF